MPHKHTRSRVKDADSYDLAPSAIARPLPVGSAARESSNPTRSKKPKPGRKKATIGGYGEDDTPRAFTRLMRLRATGKVPSGLDDGHDPTSKKRKRDEEVARDAMSAPAQEVLKIQPGERLGDFAARVDQALPFSGLKRRGKNEGRQTKHEKRLRRLQAQWREEEARIREKEAEARELAEEDADELEAMLEDKTEDIPEKGKRKGKRRKFAGEVDDGHDDPWAILEERHGRPKGLHDVAQAPPQFKVLPKEKFKIKDGARVDVGDVPAAAGSLRRREELGEARRSVIENYRRLMNERRGRD